MASSGLPSRYDLLQIIRDQPRLAWTDGAERFFGEIDDIEDDRLSDDETVWWIILRSKLKDGGPAGRDSNVDDYTEFPRPNEDPIEVANAADGDVARMLTFVRFYYPTPIRGRQTVARGVFEVSS